MIDGTRGPDRHVVRDAAWLGAAGVFAVLLVVLVVPPVFTEHGGNVFAAGYSLDVVSCWLVLAVRVVHEARTRRPPRPDRPGPRIVPGVAVGLVAYLLIRERADHPA